MYTRTYVYTMFHVWCTYVRTYVFVSTHYEIVTALHVYMTPRILWNITSFMYTNSYVRTYTCKYVRTCMQYVRTSPTTHAFLPLIGVLWEACTHSWSGSSPGWGHCRRSPSYHRIPCTSLCRLRSWSGPLSSVFPRGWGVPADHSTERGRTQTGSRWWLHFLACRGPWRIPWCESHSCKQRLVSEQICPQ